MSFTGNENHSISLADAAALTKNYRDSQQSPDYIKGEYFGKEAILSVLNQTECVGVRIYYGLSDEGIPKLVIVGAKANENDMVEGNILDYGTPCPPVCGNMNALNS